MQIRNTLASGFFLLLLFSTPLTAQRNIYLRNASFEDSPEEAKTPVGWESCGEYSSPDVLPGPWGVYQKATDGNTFVGLITREDLTWEMMGQRLSRPLEAQTCYEFSISLARSPAYTGYNEPVRMRIWAGNSLCDKQQLLLKSVAIDHYEWKSYDFMFYTEAQYNYILIECFYKEGALLPYRGNLLMDEASAFAACKRADAGTALSPLSKNIR